MSNFLAGRALAGRVTATPAVAATIMVEQRPKLAARDAVAHRGPVSGLPSVSAGAAVDGERLAQLRPAAHRIKHDQKGGALVILYRETQTTMVGLQAHLAIEQARGQHQRAVEGAKIGGGKRQGLHGLAVHVHQPHAHRLVDYEAAFLAQCFGQDAFEVKRLAGAVNGAVGKEESTALGLFRGHVAESARTIIL